MPGYSRPFTGRDVASGTTGRASVHRNPTPPRTRRGVRNSAMTTRFIPGRDRHGAETFVAGMDTRTPKIRGISGMSAATHTGHRAKPSVCRKSPASGGADKNPGTGCGGALETGLDEGTQGGHDARATGEE